MGIWGPCTWSRPGKDLVAPPALPTPGAGGQDWPRGHLGDPCSCPQTLFAGYTDNLVRVWQVTIGTR